MQITQRVNEVNISQPPQPGVILAVRVNATDHSPVAIDFSTQPPELTLLESTGDKPITVVLVADQALGMKSAKGDPVHALTLTIATGVDTPYQIPVGNAVPASALPLMYPGSKLYAKLGAGPNDDVDWAAGPVKP